MLGKKDGVDYKYTQSVCFILQLFRPRWFTSICFTLWKQSQLALRPPLMMVALRRCYRISVALSSVASLSGFCGGVWDSLARQSEVEICLFSSRSWAIEGSPVCPEAVDKRCSSCVGGTVHRCRQQRNGRRCNCDQLPWIGEKHQISASERIEASFKQQYQSRPQSFVGVQQLI